MSVATNANRGEESAVAVLPHVRVVPAGLEKDGRMRFTLLLSADRTKGDTGFTMAEWPVAVARHFLAERVHVLIHEIDLDEFAAKGRKLCIPQKEKIKEQEVVARNLAAALKTSGRLADLARLWNITWAKRTSWPEVADILEQSLSGSELRAAEAIRSDEVIAPDLEFEDRQITVDEARNDKEVASILAVPHADLALALEYGRAHELAESLAEPDPVKRETARRLRMKRVAQVTDVKNAYKELFDSMLAMRKGATALFTSTCDSLKQGQCFRSGVSDSWAGRATYFTAAKAEAGGFDEPRKVQDYVSWVQKKRVDSAGPGTSGAGAATDPAATSPAKGDAQSMAGLLSVLQSTPVLARLYGFAVDVTLHPDKKAAPADAAEVADDKPVFYLLSCSLAAKVAEAAGVQEKRPRVWTLACRRGKQFTAATHAELAMALDPAATGGVTAQFGGHLVMSAGFSSGADGVIGPARFDITTMALRQACDAEGQRRAVRQDLTQGWDALAHGASLGYGGLTLLDRGAQAAAVARLAALDCKMQSGCGSAITDKCDEFPHGHVILDSQDLTIGYRMDIGVPEGASGYRWFTADSRRVRWGQSGDPQACEIIRRLLPDLTGYGTAFRIGLDSPAQSAGVRLVPLRTDFSLVEAAVDEEFIAWTDTPAGFEADLNSRRHTEPLLPMGRIVSVPDAVSDAKLPLELLGGAQRYGHAYRVKLRAVYQGGVSVPINDGVEQLEKAEARLAYPPLPGEEDAFRPFVRLLRQSGIGAPQVGMDRDTAFTSNGAMPPEECTRMVVRSMTGPASDAEARARPSRTLRLVVPPNVSWQEASRHGKFGGAQDRRTAMPPGGLRGIWMNARGGFRGTLDRTRAGMNGVRHYIGRDIADPPANGESPGPSVRNLVLTRDTRPAERRLGRYYPDPAADMLALRLFWMDDPAHAASDSVIVAWNQSWPDLPPVAVELIAGRAIGQPMMQAEGRLELPILPDQILPRVRVRLMPGERVFLDAWCVPSAERLAREFSIVQSLAIVWDRKSAKRPKGRISDPGPAHRYIGPGGIVTPPAKQIVVVAKFLHDELRKNPLPDIAAALRLPLIHATNKPASAPRLRDVAALRLSHGTMTNLQAASPGGVSEDTPDAEPGATGFILTGSIDLPLPQTGGFQIVGSVTLPGRSVFDDEERGRSLAQKRADVWPRDPQKRDGTSAFRKAEALFGFKVFADGQVELPMSEVLLLRMAELPPLIRGAKLDEPASIPLDACFLADPGKPTDYGRRSGGHVFGDGKARHMILWPESTARTAPEMTMMARVEDNRLVGETPLLDGDLVTQGETVRVTLPASVRPLPPRALSPYPIFWLRQTRDRQMIELRRSARIRLPLGRGWFSSGVDERLGIIFWPPELPLSDPLRERDVLPLEPGAALRHCLRDFVDEDLGPGGAYVSRMGADPIRSLAQQSGWHGFAAPSVFMSPAAIRNCEAAGYVASVPMPLSMPEDESDKKPVPVLTVALQTFAPRFDAAAETWYVDLDIDSGGLVEPFVRLGLLRYQPHAPLALRASSPVVQWMQPIEDRRIRLDRTGNRITIRVQGAARGAERAMLRARLLAETTVMGLPERREICRVDAAAGTDVLELEPAEPDRRAARLVLFLEEIEQFQPAQYSSEPVSPETGPSPADPFTIRSLACIRDVERLFG